jgi:hypothetical protein
MKKTTTSWIVLSLWQQQPIIKKPHNYFLASNQFITFFVAGAVESFCFDFFFFFEVAAPNSCRLVGVLLIENSKAGDKFLSIFRGGRLIAVTVQTLVIVLFFVGIFFFAVSLLSRILQPQQEIWTCHLLLPHHRYP